MWHIGKSLDTRLVTGDIFESLKIHDSKGNFGYPWEGTLADVSKILPHIALYNHCTTHAQVVYVGILHISGTFWRVPNFSLWMIQSIHLYDILFYVVYMSNIYVKYTRPTSPKIVNEYQLILNRRWRGQVDH